MEVDVDVDGGAGSQVAGAGLSGLLGGERLGDLDVLARGLVGTASKAAGNASGEGGRDETRKGERSEVHDELRLQTGLRGSKYIGVQRTVRCNDLVISELSCCC